MKYWQIPCCLHLIIARSGSGLFISLLVSPTIVRRHFYFSNSWTSFEIITLFFFVFKNNYSISLTFHIFCYFATLPPFVFLIIQCFWVSTLIFRYLSSLRDITNFSQSLGIQIPFLWGNEVVLARGWNILLPL